MLFDMPLEELRTYLPAREEPVNFDAFWVQTLAETRTFPWNHASSRWTLAGHRGNLDVTFNGYSGLPMKGWLLLPRQRQEPLPLRRRVPSATAVVEPFPPTGWCGAVLVTPTW